MPELPEIQALSERIDAALRGASIIRVEPIAFAALKTVTPSPEELAGTSLARTGRRGKFLELGFDPLRVLVHLSQGGRIDLQPAAKARGRPKGGVVRFVFDREPALLVKEFGTERKAGWWVLGPGDDGPLAKLGPDPFSDGFEELVLRGTDSSRLHAMLRDQRRVAGIGRGYADDILHRARLSPYRSLSSLTGEERERFLAAVRSTLADGLEMERRRTGGLPTKVGDHWIVHGRSGTPCPTCGTELRRISYESHEVTYCPSCQTEGRVLADRRLSRLVR
jgi:formamidopyrimidine-DNA glycosylase